MSNPDRPSIYRLQFRLRTLLIVAAILSVPCAWVSFERRQIAQRRDLFISMPSTFGEGYVPADEQPKWHRTIFGLDPLRGAILIIAQRHLTDADLAHLKAARDLHQLFLNHTQVTDAGLVYLQRMTQLQTLEVTGTQVTDAGITELQKTLPNCTIIR